MPEPSHLIRDLSLAQRGLRRIEWAERDMLVLGKIREEFQKRRPLRGIQICACLHVTPETANLVRVLQDGGASVALCATNPLSTQDDIAASLVADFGCAVYGIKGADRATYREHMQRCLDHLPDLIIDDGADMILTYQQAHERGKLLGATEETTNGLNRLRVIEQGKKLCFPVIAANEGDTKHLFDSRYGTGQSTIDGIIRATNLLMSGRVVVVAGYGWCGRGVAMRARGLGANVIITEVDPLKALEAVMDGYRVLPMSRAAKEGDVFVTVTGDVAVLRTEHFEVMRDGALLCNAGNYDLEIDVPALEADADSAAEVRPFVREYRLRNGKRLYLLGEGQVINLAAAEGHPASVMDISFANQALCTEYLVSEGQSLAPIVHRVPRGIDRKIALLKLECLGMSIDHSQGKE